MCSFLIVTFNCQSKSRLKPEAEAQRAYILAENSLYSICRQSYVTMEYHEKHALLLNEPLYARFSAPPQYKHRVVSIQIQIMPTNRFIAFFLSLKSFKVYLRSEFA